MTHFIVTPEIAQKYGLTIKPPEKRDYNRFESQATSRTQRRREYFQAWRDKNRKRLREYKRNWDRQSRASKKTL